MGTEGPTVTCMAEDAAVDTGVDAAADADARVAEVLRELIHQLKAKEGAHPAYRAAKSFKQEALTTKMDQAPTTPTPTKQEAVTTKMDQAPTTHTPTTHATKKVSRAFLQ